MRSSTSSRTAHRPPRYVALLGLVLLVGLLVAPVVLAQGLPTATLTGRVHNDALDLPGVTVTVKSPSLQGTRTSVTGANGDYVIANLPPGLYQVTFAIQGFKTQTLSKVLGASQQVTLDANLAMAVAATTTVTAQSDAISQSPAQATTYTAETLGKLPTGRTVTSAVILSPGVNQNGPNGISISGAQSTENLYTVNGVTVTDNVRSTLNNLYIEDALQETTTTTSTVSAEYGRFTGGVVNAITKSGGNTFSGSFRTTLSNDAWNSTSGYRTATGVNPQEGTFTNSVVPTYEATLGGPILKDMLWFFGSGRYFDTSDSITSLTRFTNIPYTGGTKETRYEGKLTFSPFPNHTLTGDYTGIKNEQINYNFGAQIPVADLASNYDRQLPQELLVFNYNGVLSSSLFLEGSYSRRKFTFENSGGRFRDNVNGTVIRDLGLGISYNAPIFCGVCGPEKRDNNEYFIKGTYFLSTPSLGSHTILVGYDNFGGQRESNNYQSGSNFVVYTFGSGRSVFQGQNVYPVFEPGITEIDYWPVLQKSQGSDIRTQSAFINDAWRLNDRISFNVGVRWDKNDATDAAGNVTSKDSKFSPRLAATYDVKGNGALRVTASYAKYVAALQETQAGSGATLAGAPADFYWYYDGAPINTGSGPYLTSQQALAQLFDWFQAGGCLPDPLSANCTIPQGGAPSIGGVNVQIQNGLSSPNANEYVFGIAGNFAGSRGSFRTDFVRREYKDYYDLKKDLSTGTVVSPFGAVQDLGLIVNSSDYRREYTGLHTQLTYRLGNRLNVGANWTWSHLIGDLIGETSGSGPIRGGLHVYPEYLQRSWNSPVGDLSQDQRHRVRVYGQYDVPVPPSFGNLNVGLVQSFDTGTPYGAAGTIRTGSYVTNPGYKTPPASETYYFTGRDAYRTETVYRTDLQLSYSHRIVGGLEIFVQPQIFNLLNAQHIISVNQTVNTNFNTSNLVAFNPFTTAAPLECPQGTALASCKTMGANYQKGSLFGTPTASTGFQTPRYFTMSVGLRF